uniref:tRNA-uridine aminocarboxypropyltransferase 1 n=1 Tax=Ciona savignyi TaxID=51511 RepID=H2Y9I3_CIOSA
MYFCYSCYQYVDGIDVKDMPHVKLPIKVDIIKHQKELDGKSTAVHAVMLAPEDVEIYSYPIIPNYANDKDQTLLIFPGPDAKHLRLYSTQSGKKRSVVDDVVMAKKIHLDNSSDVQNENRAKKSEFKLKEEKLNPTFNKIVFIDSTWSQVHSILTDERLKSLSRVELSEKETCYWRKQNNRPNTHLATIEAIHSFFQQFHQIFIGEYDGKFDNLLFFYKFFYSLVKKSK